MATHRYNEGDTLGDLRILIVLGQSRTPRGNNEPKGRKEWFYQVQCTCGRKERASQRALREGKNACNACTRSRASRKPLAPKSIGNGELPYGIPDPALLPVPSSIKTRPEQYG